MMRDNGYISITTETLKGQCLRLRDLSLADTAGLASCIRDSRFSYPVLTGTSDPVRQPLRPLRRAMYYALVCKCANSFGHILFGKRRHWIISVFDGTDNTFLGVVMVDELMHEGRDDGATRPGNSLRLGNSFLKHPEQRLPIRIGDGELGFFMHPRVQRQGIALQAMYVLLDCLSLQRDLSGKPILGRVWAETGTMNLPAKNLLRKMGLVEHPEFAVTPALSRRYERDGAPIGLVHFDQPDTDEQTDSCAPIRARLQELVQRKVVYPNWRFHE